MNMPDTEKNRATFGKRRSQHGPAGFPQLRLVTLLVGATHVVLDLAYAACCGKGTGEQSLLKHILQRLPWRQWLLLLDAGLYSFALAWTIAQRDERFIMKVKQGLRLRPIKGSACGEGSYLAVLSGQVDGQQQELTVRVIDVQLRGFRPFRLITNLLDEKISAREIVRHYHQRWEVEIAFDEIKTHQCATLRGQSPTILRSRRPDLVQQELYALLLSYNALRVLMWRAAEQAGKKPCALSFLDSLQAVIEATPLFNWPGHPAPAAERQAYLLVILAASEVEYARRPRLNPRVVKVRLSKFPRKNSTQRGEQRDFDEDLSILAPHDNSAQACPLQEAA